MIGSQSNWNTRRFWSGLTAVVLGGLATLCTLLPVRGDTVPAYQAPQPKPAHRLQTIKMDLDYRPKTRPEQGKLSGYDPVVTEVHVGDRIQFVNVDDNQHTATGYAFGGQTIPEHYRFQGDPSVAHGSVINASEWSTGNVRPHGKSKVFNTGPTGTFYFACAYHQGNGMRGAIVVKQ